MYEPHLYLNTQQIMLYLGVAHINQHLTANSLIVECLRLIIMQHSQLAFVHAYVCMYVSMYVYLSCVGSQLGKSSGHR